MPGDVSYRSIEIQLSNNTPSTLSVQSAVTVGTGASWIGGEQPSGSLSPFANVVWGVMTLDPSAEASATVALAGAGSELAVGLRCPGGAPAQASVADHPSIAGTIQQVDAGTDSHASFQVVLSPRAPAADAPATAAPEAVQPAEASDSAEPDGSAVADPAEPAEPEA